MHVDQKNIHLLVEGKAAFDYIIKAIEEAKESIYINMFIWRDDLIGNEMAKAVLKAANRGVKVKIIKDKLGCIFEYAEESRQSFFHKEKAFLDGCQSMFIDLVYPMKNKGSRKQLPNQLAQALKKHQGIALDVNDYRKDHSKYYIIDETILILGGINIEDKEIYCDKEGKTYHDYMIAIESKNTVKFFIQRLKEKDFVFKANAIDFIFNQTIDGRVYFGVKESILQMFELAKESIVFVMAYIGDQEIIDKVITLANQGISIEFIVPGKANLQHDINLKILKDIMKATNNQVKVYLNPKMVHGKLIYIDGQWLSFGSTNLNKQAMEQLLELNIVMKVEDAIKEQLETAITDEKAKSLLINHYDDLKYKKMTAFFEGFVC